MHSLPVSLSHLHLTYTKKVIFKLQQLKEKVETFYVFVTKTVHDYLNRVRLGPGLMEETQVLDFFIFKLY